MNKQLLSLSFSTSNSILLVGAGYMGVEYAKALKKLKKKFVVIGRGEKSAKEFEKQIGQKVLTGGLDSYLRENKNTPAMAIVALSEEQLGTAAINLLNHGVKLILVEKPAGLDFEDIKNVYNLLKRKKLKFMWVITGGFMPLWKKLEK